jgi:hypothetical protein
LLGCVGAAWLTLSRGPETFDEQPAQAANVPVPRSGSVGAQAASDAASAAVTSAPTPAAAGVKGRDLVGEIREALAQGTPAAALAAAELIERCMQADKKVAELFAARDEHTFQDVLAQKTLSLFGVDERTLLDHMQREQRNCQALDAQTRALRPALLKTALEAGADGAAAHYLQWLVETQGAGADPKQIEALQQTLRSEADAGSVSAMYALAGERLPTGVTPAARQAYVRATDLIEDSWAADGAMGGFVRKMRAVKQLFGGSTVDPSLSPEQLRAAEQRAQRLFEAYQGREAARRRTVS